MEQTAQLPANEKQTDDPVSTVAHNMATLLGQINQMETFIKRRFDEISMEINATSQQIDMSEDGMAKRFGEILGAMNSISFSGDGTTPANTGVELEAVITETSKAANTILDSCDVMNELLYPEDNFVFENAEAREEWLGKLRDGIQGIMIACSFQDIAGQRIRKTLDSINEIEDRITGALEGLGVASDDIKAAAQSKKQEAVQSGNSQDDIDALFS